MVARRVCWREGRSRVGTAQAEAAFQAGQQRPGRQQLDPGGGQLDGQRQPVEAAADRRDVGGVVGGDGEPRPDQVGLLDE